MKQRAWLCYPAIAVTALLVYEAVPHAKPGWLFNLIALSSPIVIMAATRMWNPTVKAPWYLVAFGQSLFVAGDVISYNYDKIFHTDLPFPSLADIPTMSVYPCVIAGILLLVRTRSPGRNRDGLIDSLIVAVALGVISWSFLMGPIAHDSASTVIQKLVSMTYPFMDLVLLTVVVRLVMAPGRRGLAFYLLPAAALSLFVTDFFYSYISVQGQVYNQSGSLEAGWAAFYILWGAAALHPSMATLSERGPEQEIRLARARLVLLGAAALTAQAVSVVQLTRGQQTDMWIITASTTIMFVLVVIRMSGLVHKLELSFGREKALRTAGASLETATNRESIYAAVIDAVSRLSLHARAQLLVRVDDGVDGEQFAVVAASEDGLDLVGTHVEITTRTQTRLHSRRSTVIAWHPEIAKAYGFPAGTSYLLMLPMLLRDQLNALLVVGSVDKVLPSVSDALEALASQVVLALESAALTEDLLRQQSEARFASLVQNSSDVVMIVDADSNVRYVSPSVDRVLGYAASDLEGTRLVDLVSVEDKARVLQFLTTGAHTHDDQPHPARTEFRLRHHHDFWLNAEAVCTNLLDDENVRGIVLNVRDVSERKAFEQQLEHQAFHDSVTGLANRALFKDRVEHALERRARDRSPVSVLFMDLDDFKTINDSLGHAAGDIVLGEVGERLKRCLRAADTAARLGGDEFAILLEDSADGIDATEVAVRILEALDGAIQLENQEVFVRASIGIASGDDGSECGPESAEELLRNADVAMYMAKEGGKGRYQVFEPAMHDTALRRLELKADLQRAVDSTEFILHYQPMIALQSGEIEGLEALLRWQHPERGLVRPLDFVPLAEETGLIVPIEKWVMREACKQARTLQELYPKDPPLHMAVNLSARQLQRPEIVSDVADILHETGLDPSSLVIEITESVMMRDMELSIQRLGELKNHGVKLAVDDFGTGYSSLNYIRRFPVDILKVDKSFIDGVADSGEEAALTAAIIELAGILRLRPVAEGIERADQLEKLRLLNCELGQGFYFAKPMPIEGISELLHARKLLQARERELAP
jgi:diguanylate cyclase (GGDEF)-like protein/PAS domain S-box-containing protein